LGLAPQRAASAVRLTLGRTTSDADISYALDALRDVVDRLRAAA